MASDDASVSPGVAPGLQTSGPAQNPGPRAVEVTGARSPVSRAFVNYETDIYVSPPAENARTSYTSDNAVVSSTHPLTPIRPLATVSGSITVSGDPYTLTISTSGDTGQVTFSGTAGENVGLGLTNVALGTSTCCSSFVSILNPDGTTLKSISVFGTNGADVNVPTLPTTGTYTIVIDPQGNTGSVTLTLSDDTTGTIAVGGASTSITIPRVGQNGRVTFSGTAGEFLGLGLSPVTIGPSTCCSSFVSILKPDGTTLKSISAFGTNGATLNVPTLPTTGTYAIVIDPQLNTGSVTLILSDDVMGTITVGSASTSITIPRVGQNGRVTFSGTAGEFLGLGLSPVSIGASGCCAAFVSVLKPDGTNLMNPAAFGNNGQNENIPGLPTTGTYTLFIDPGALTPTDTGSVTLTLSDDVTGTIAVGGSSTTMKMSRVGQNGRVTFSGTAGEHLGLGLSPVTIGTSGCCAAFVSVLNPDGTTLMNPAAFGTSGQSENVPMLPTTGAYTIFLDPGALTNTDTGSATLTLSDDVTGLLTVGGPSGTYALSRIGQNGRVTFSGSAGETVQLATSNDTIGTGCCATVVTILKPDGSNLMNPAAVGNGTTVTMTLTVAGTYTIMVDPQGILTGSITFALTVGAGPSQNYGCGQGGVYGLKLARCASAMLADPVNSLTGAYQDEVTDLVLPGTVIPFTFALSYTSADPTPGRLGKGWTDSLAASLAIQGNGDVIVRSEDGQQVFFSKQTDGSYVGAAGALATLSVVGGGYQLLRNDQVTESFDSQGRLTSIKERNNQGLTLGYDPSGRLSTVTDAAGRIVTFTTNADGTVSKVSLPDGNSMSYGYTNGLLTSVTDPLGKVTSYTYDGGGRLATEVDPNNHTVVSNVYDASGRVSQQTDANGKTSTFAWDASTQTETVTDPRNGVWKDVYQNGVLLKRIDAAGNVTQLGHDDSLDNTSVAAPSGDTTSMTYDSHGNLLTATAPASLGSVQKTFTYDSQNNLASVTDARGKVTTYGYDARGNNTSIVQDGKTVAQYAYNAAGQVTSSTDGNGKTTTDTYDANGNVASATDPLGNKTTYTYDAEGRVLTRVDPLGNVTGGNPAAHTTTYTYDAAGRLLTETDPLGNKTTNTYDGAGNRLTVIDANNHTTTYAYDAANHLTSVTDPLNHVTSYTYDAAGNRITVTDPLNHTTTYGYDSDNGLQSVTTPANEKTTYGYDANGDVASKTDPLGNTTSYTYDAAGRPLTQTDPLGHKTTNAYNAVGILASVTDANNHPTTYSYDASGRILSVTAPDGGVTSYTYDGNGNVLTRTDANNHTTGYTYDAGNELKTRTSPLSQKWTNSYDANGNLTSLLDAKGGTTTYTDDADNRLTTIAYSDTTPSVSYAYDAVGNRTSMTDGSGSVTYAYDAANRLTSVTRGTNTFSYGYDSAGDLTGRTYPDSTTITATYDADNHLASASSGGATTIYAYDAAGNLTQTTLPSANGYLETRTYDKAGRLTEIKNAKGGSVLSDYAYTLDSVGNPTTVVQTGAVGSTTTYGYDAKDRLTSVCFQAGCPGANDPFIRWTYDKVGNRLTEARSTGTTNYSYNVADELTSAGSTAYTYDLDGNETAAGSRTFKYNLANELISTTSGSTTTTYTYDSDGNRLQASTGSQASAKTNYLWDVNGALPQLALERDGNNNLLRRYIYGGRRISMTTSGGTYYYAYDGLGSVVNLTSSAGATEWTYSYEPFGTIKTATKNDTKAPTNLTQFAAEYLDPTGLYYLRARQYGPTTGRFNSIDPAGSDPITPGISSYVYAANRPTVLIDPSGQTFQQSTLGEDASDLPTSGADIADAAASSPRARIAYAYHFLLDYFLSAGFHDHLARILSAGLVGNFWTETERDPLNTHLQNGSHCGIAQWNGCTNNTDRWKLLLTFAQDHHISPWSLTTQLRFAWYELHTTQRKRAWLPLLKAKSVKEAATIVEADYERAGGAGLGKRIKYAQCVYKNNFDPNTCHP